MQSVKYSLPVVFLIFFVFVSCTKKIIKKQTIIKKKGCSIEVILKNKRVCLDGPWILSKSCIPSNRVYFFRRKRNFLVLEPAITKKEKKDYESRVKAGALDTSSILYLLTIEGRLSGDSLILEYHNPFVVYTQVYKYGLSYYKGKFFGVLRIYTQGSGRTKEIRVSLVRKNCIVLDNEKDSDEKLPLDF
ncbi:MAG: hypothetical protein KAS64_11745 [Spirochaetes bacterium]|nr:hypothetical protein [Spirochaetota bacterium]